MVEASGSKTERLLEELEGEEPYDADLLIARELADVSQLLVGVADVEGTLAMTCRLAADHIPGCEAAGVLLLSRRTMRSVGATGELARAVDDLQCRMGEGPSFDVVRTGGKVRVDDFRTDARWPSFGAAAGEATGVRSMLAYRLHAGGRTMGALDLYSSRPDAFDRGSKTTDLGAVFASHAAVALAGAQALEGLRTALESRETISVAMGILMARQQITRTEAFDVLRRASQRENVKLRDIAARIAGDINDVVAEG